jgi:hypothetical protein
MWNRTPFQPQSLDVNSDRIANQLQDFGAGFSHSDTSGQIRNIGPKRRWPLFHHDHEFHAYPCLFNPACLSTLFNVPGGISTLGFPATVTVPALDGW